MKDVAEFVQIRQGIESLAKEIAVLVERRTMPQSRSRLNEASQLLAQLTVMADNDVQKIAVGRLTRLVGGLTAKVDALETKKRPAKKVVTS